MRPEPWHRVHLCLALIHPFRCWPHPLTPTCAGALAELVQSAQGIQPLSPPTQPARAGIGRYPALRLEVSEWGTGRSVSLPPWLFKSFLYFPEQDQGIPVAVLED